MVTDNQARRLKKMLSEGKNLSISAARAGMDEKTARKYRDTVKLPSELKKEHKWRTRIDPFEKDWEQIREMIYFHRTRTGIINNISIPATGESW